MAKQLSTQSGAPAGSQKNTAQPTLLATLLLPMQASQLLVPNVSMAELVGHQLPQRPAQSLPDWIQGFVQWRGESVPLVLYENYLGKRRGAEANDLRIAIMNSISERYRGRFYGLLIQGIPRMLKVTEEDLVNVSGEPAAGSLFQVDTPLGQADLPDLEALEEALGQALP
ncbi:MAG: chemotaxis protein CheW [Natronospirillum sp.]